MKNNTLKTTEEYLKEVSSKFGDLYDYSEIEYISAKHKIKVRCFEHGYFLQEASYFVNKSHGCPKCRKKTLSINSRSNSEEFIDKAKIVHKNKYDYGLVKYITSNIKVDIICPVHGVFSQTPNNHLRDRGCNLCRFKNSSSKMESELSLFLENLGVTVISNNRFSWLNNKELDIYIPSLNLAIEYNGYVYHHSTKGISKFLDNTYVDPDYHLNKYNLCKENGIDLIHIFEFEDLNYWRSMLGRIIYNSSSFLITFENQFRSVELFNKNLNFYGISIISSLTDN